MRITNEQIIQSARRQRETVNNRMDVAPWSRHQRPRRGLAAAIAIAASFISFITGYGVHANISQSVPATAFVPTYPNLTSSQWRRTSLCNTTLLCILRPSETPCIRCVLSPST